MNTPTVVPILSSTVEAKDIKTFTFEYPGEITPGQFFMIWIPGVDEIPMSVSLILGDTKGITFRRVGDATSALYDLDKGDRIGVRGPYGHGFTIHGNHPLFVSGGTGAAMLAPAVEVARVQGLPSIVILGVKTKNELFFEERLRKAGAQVLVSTDDGTKGSKGFATDLARSVLQKEPIDGILTCGPEIMMKTLMDISVEIPFEASLERYMKCSMGLCGQCSIGSGLRVCADGPVFPRSVLEKTPDFGVYKRDAAGRKIPV